MTIAKGSRELSPARDLLNHKESATDLQPLSALDHLAFAHMLDEGADVKDALDALKLLRQEYVDWNEIRVARVQEVAKTIASLPHAEKVAARIKEDYNSFFDKKGALSFDFLAAGKPSESKRALAQLLPRLNKGAVALLLYEFCPGASLPLTDECLKQARKDGVIGKSGDRNQLVKVFSDSFVPGEICRLIQHWELAATGNPYGEVGRKEIAANAAKPKRPTGKSKAGTRQK